MRKHSALEPALLRIDFGRSKIYHFAQVKMRSILEAFKSERRRLEIVGSTGLGNEISMALAEYNAPEGESYSIVSQGRRIGKRIETMREHGRDITRVFYYIDVPIAYNINSRNGVEVEGSKAKFYTSDFGTKFEYLGDADRKTILKFKKEVPHPIFPRTPVAP